MIQSVNKRVVKFCSNGLSIEKLVCGQFNTAVNNWSNTSNSCASTQILLRTNTSLWAEHNGKISFSKGAAKKLVKPSFWRANSRTSDHQLKQAKETLGNFSEEKWPQKSFNSIARHLKSQDFLEFPWIYGLLLTLILWMNEFSTPLAVKHLMFWSCFQSLSSSSPICHDFPIIIKTFVVLLQHS